VDERANLILRRVAAIARPPAAGTQADPVLAGGVQQPVHVGGRPDGRDIGQYGLVGQHQGTAGFFLRHL
jgi:hypothetical protein